MIINFLIIIHEAMKFGQKKNKSYPYIILAIIGVLIEVIAFQVKPEEMSFKSYMYDLLFNAGFVILAIVIVQLFWFLLGGEPLEEIIRKAVAAFELAADGFAGGLCRTFFSSSNFATSGQWISLLDKANSSVDMMGYSLHMLTRSTEFQQTLAKLANKNVKIRILIMDSENKHFEAGLNFEGVSFMSLDSMKEEISTCTHCVEIVKNQVEKNKQNNIEFVKIKRGLTECQIIRIDDKMYVTPYLFSQHTADSPLFIYREQKSGYYEKYMGEFNMLWEQNCSMEEGTG